MVCYRFLLCSKPLNCILFTAQKMFSHVLNSLHVEQQKQQTSARSGFLNQAPSANQLINPDLQIAILAVMIAQQVQVNQPQFVNNPETQQYILNCLQNQGIRGVQVGLRRD